MDEEMQALLNSLIQNRQSNVDSVVSKGPITLQGNPSGVSTSAQNTPKSSFNFGSLAQAGAGAILNSPLGDKMLDTLNPWHHIAGQNHSKVGDVMNTAGKSLLKVGVSTGQPYVMLAGAALNTVSGIANAGFGYGIENEQAVKDNINRLNHVQFGGDYDALQQQYADASMHTVGLGKVTNGWFNKRGSKKAAKLKKQQEDALGFAQNAFSNATENYAGDVFGNFLSNYAALGGPLQSHGSDWSNNIVEVNSGDTHEQNPLGGVMMGIAPDGEPNFVEEGEVIYNGYVFSNRIRVPKKVIKEYKLKGGKDMTFADAIKNAQKESEERPNDPISKRGLEDIVAKLMMEQEFIRQKKEMNRRNKEHAYGGHLFGGNSEPTQQMLNPYAFSKIWDGFNYYNPKTRTYDEGYLNFVNNINQNWVDRIMSGTYGPMNRYLATNNGTTPSISNVKRLAADHKYSDMHKAVGAAYEDYLNNDPFESKFIAKNLDTNALGPGIEPDILTKTINAGPVTPTGKASDLSNSDNIFDAHFNNKVLGRGKGRRNADDKRNLLTYLRYAPVLGAGISLLNKRKPNYDAADFLLGAINSNMRDIDYMPIGDYMAYNPLDRLFYANQLGAQTGATRRNILNTSNANRGTAIAGMLANDYNAQENLGKLYRAAEEYNLDQRHKVADFNQKTNMFNAENYLKKEMANQDNARAKVNALAQVASMRERALADAASYRSADLTNFLQGLGDIGREEVEAAWINKNPAYYYTADRYGRGIPYKFNPYTGEAITAKNGGFLTIKNKRRSK